MWVKNKEPSERRRREEIQLFIEASTVAGSPSARAAYVRTLLGPILQYWSSYDLLYIRQEGELASDLVLAYT